MKTTVIFYRTFNNDIPIVDWIVSDRILTHIEKFSRFVWWQCNETVCRQIVIKQSHYILMNIHIDYNQSYIERYKLCNDICRFFETLPPHKPLPVINEFTHPEFYI